MNRRGMTLVEMMVATAATLLLMGAIAQIFSVFGTAVSDSRSVIDLDGRMRSVAWRLRSDLDGVTAGTNPPLSPEADEGYFEVIEGPNNDQFIYVDPVTSSTYAAGFDKWTSPAGPSSSDDRILGDTDDVLLFTTRNVETEFLGKFLANRIESPVAEVAWFLRPTSATANPTTFTLYRRQLLVVGYVGAPPFAKGTGTDENLVDTQLNGGLFSSWTNFYNAFDLSVRGSAYSSGTAFLPNTLGDLTRRESRFMHNPAGVTNGAAFPYRFIGPGVAHQSSPPPAGLTFDGINGSTRVSEDVILTNVIAFDVRVFDPAAPVAIKPGYSTALGPGDKDFTSYLTSGTVAANGCYVDLGSGTTGLLPSQIPAGIAPRFASFGAPKSQLMGSLTTPRVWDSWSSHYETNGVDEDNANGIDQGTNGLDDDTNGLVDEPPIDLNRDGIYEAPGELETSPPYPFPLRGIEVRIRCYEPSSRQVRQMTVRQTLVR